MSRSFRSSPAIRLPLRSSERWADEARKNARQIEDEAERKAALIKCNEAEEIAWEMRAYRKGEKAVTAKRASMSEAAVSSETPADKLAMIEGCQAFREAAYHLKMAEEKTRQHRRHRQCDPHRDRIASRRDQRSGNRI